nr:DNA-directed DNA polymerase [Tanacetum cinerariifolium]
MQNQLTNLTDLITKFMNSNATSTSSSGTLPSNTIANPKSDLKAITTRSGVLYDGPQIPPLVVENELEATKDTLNPTKTLKTSNLRQSNLNLQLLLSQQLLWLVLQSLTQKLQFHIHQGETMKGIKLCEMARTPLNEHCSAVLLKKLPKKLEDPGKFLIPYDFPGMAECLALADLGASINLMPFSVWKTLSLPDLTPTCMTLELADRSNSRLVRVAKDVYVKVGSFHFSADLVVVDFDPDPRVPLILGRSFLKTERALIDIFEEGDILLLEAFLNDDPSLPPPNQRNYLLEVRKELKICEAKTDKSSVDEPPMVELKALPPHLEYAFLEGNDKLLVIIAKDLSVEEKTALLTVLNPMHCVLKKGGITVVENEDNELIPTRVVTGLRVCIDYHKLNEATRKDHLPFMDQMLERLAGNQYYCFLDNFSGYFHIPIDPKDQEKTTFTYPYGTFAYRRIPFGLCKAPGTCEDTNICLNWEKSHFMVKEGIVLGHKISKKGIEVDKAKVDVISKLPHPTTVK